jgi:hypothetical protein
LAAAQADGPSGFDEFPRHVHHGLDNRELAVAAVWKLAHRLIWTVAVVAVRNRRDAVALWTRPAPSDRLMTETLARRFWGRDW